MTNLRVRTNRDYNPTTGYVSSLTKDYSFDLHVLYPDQVGINTYNEIPGHPIDESKWETILSPLYECWCEEQLQDTCQIIRKALQVIGWDGRTQINWLDNNFTGWTYSITLRDTDPQCGDDVPSFAAVEAPGFTGTVQIGEQQVRINQGRGFFLTTETGTVDVSILTGGGTLVTDRVEIAPLINLEILQGVIFGGVVIPTKQALATQLSITPQEVATIQNDGTDTTATFTGDITIGDDAFRDSTEITKIIDGQGVITEIGAAAFIRTPNLEEAYLPALTTLGDYAFSTTPKLTKWTAPQLTDIPQFAFYGIGATSFDFSNIVTIGQQAFYESQITGIFNAPELTTLTNATWYDGLITGIRLPKLTAVQGNNFLRCKITDYDADRDTPLLDTVPNGFFSGNAEMTSARGNNIIKIDTSAFQDCTAMMSMNFPKAVTIGFQTAGTRAFQGFPNNGTATFNIALQTANAGQPDGDVQELIDKGWNITWVQ